MGTRRSHRFEPPRFPIRTVASSALLTATLAAGAVACGTTDEASRQTLPPLVTTTTSTTTTSTTVFEDRFYTVQPGDILTVIAARRGVTVQAIVEKNGLKNEDDIFAGQILEIPT